MKKVLVILISLSLVGCMKGERGEVGTQGVPGITPSLPQVPVDEVQRTIDAVLLDENEYREGLGQSILSSGLSCTLYTITGGDRIQATAGGHNTLTGISQVASYTFTNVFNQLDSSTNDGLNALPSPLKSLYTNMYLLRCQGYVVVTRTDYYKFDLYSDDASVLYVDGAKLIDNDNGHGITLVSGTKYLRKGVHQFRLDYAQTGAGNQALILKANDSLIEGKVYAH